MINFKGLPPMAQIFILVYFLILLLINGHISSIGFIRFKRWKIGLMGFSHIILYYIVLVGLSTYLLELENMVEINPFSNYLASLAFWVYLTLIILGSILVILLLYRMRVYKDNTITKAAIKESIDNLPAGLSLSFENSFVILSNWQIDRLCHILTGKDLQDGEVFWRTLVEGQLKEGNHRWSQGPNPIISLADGRTWSFNRRLIQMANQSVVEIMAIDTTDLNKLRLQLEEDNENLRKMGLRLEQYLKNVMDIKGKEERLVAKMSIHDGLGYALLATRHFFMTREADIELGLEEDKILKLWKENIERLYGPDQIENRTALASLISTAKLVGIKLFVRGDLPEEANKRDLILLAGGECLTNSVRHAKASELYIDIEEEGENFIASFTNNGLIPKRKVIEGGGLSSLRHKIQSSGGKMEVNHIPRFNLKLIIPKEGGLDGVPCFDS